MDIEKIIEKEQSMLYFKELARFVNARYNETKVYPPKDKLFTCFKVCDMNDDKDLDR